MSKRRGIYTRLLFGVSVICFTAFLVSLAVSAIEDTSIERVIPEDALVYIKLQNLQACREAIKGSENWQEATELITGLPQWASTEHFIEMMPTFLGTDFQTLADTFLADKVAVMVSLGASGPMIGVAIQNQGKHQAVAEIFAGLVDRTDGVDGNAVSLTQETYQGIEYHTMHANNGAFRYGSVNKDLFLIGITDGSFKKMVDTYKTENTSIAANEAYRSAMDQFGGSEMFAFVNVDRALPFIKVMFPPAIGNGLVSVQSLVYSWDLLNQGGTQKLYAQMKAGQNNPIISQLEEASEIRSRQGLSGEEGFSFAMGASSLHTLWQMFILSQLAENPHTDTDLFGFFVSNETDIMNVLKGDIAIAVDAATFYTFNASGMNFRTESLDDVVKSVELEFEAINLGAVFNPDAPSEWKTFFDDIVDKMTTDPVEAFDYKGMTFNTAMIPGRLYYGTVNDLFLLALSETYFQSMVDNVLASKNVPSSQGTAGVQPAGLIQFNLHEFLSYVSSTGKLSWLSEDALMLRKKIENLSVSITVKGDEAWLELQLSEDEKLIETIAWLAPVVFMGMTKDMIQVR